ncbi:hypothetical protein EI74_0260 [Mycoplasma testudineum]|uniref:Uncharacterized protein n=1 Tax=Mycoplasma testudineum TaxID=244584 RepID=A0A4R6IEM6_9MOLU|nr:hypothetical protein EI74_0260 [Mycoplasma testudineum]
MRSDQKPPLKNEVQPFYLSVALHFSMGKFVYFQIYNIFCFNSLVNRLFLFFK